MNSQPTKKIKKKKNNKKKRKNKLYLTDNKLFHLILSFFCVVLFAFFISLGLKKICLDLRFHRRLKHLIMNLQETHFESLSHAIESLFCVFH